MPKTTSNDSELNPRILRIGAVMGTFPDAIEVAQRVSSGAFAIPQRLWKFVSNTGEQWTTISAFWRTIGKRKLSIMLASNPGLNSTTSLYGMELEFVRSLGFLANAEGPRLDFGLGLPDRAAAPRSHEISGGFLKSLALKFLPRPSHSARMRRCLTARGSDPQFEEEIRQEFSFLFREYSASVASNQRYPAACGNVIIVLASDTLLLRVVRDRDEIRIDVAPTHAPTEWKLLILAIAAAQCERRNPALASCKTLERGAQLLKDNWTQLNSSLMPDNYVETRHTIHEIETAKLVEWVTKFNPPTARAIPLIT